MVHCFCAVSKSKYWMCLNAYIFTGFFDANRDEASSLDICQHHRDRLGIYWRGRCKNCQVPPEVAQHKSAAVKGDRSLVKDQSQYIKKITGKLIPVGSGKKVSYFLNKQVFAFPKQLPVRISRVVNFPEGKVRNRKKHTFLISSDRYSSQKRKRNIPPSPPQQQQKFGRKAQCNKVPYKSNHSDVGIIR